MRTKTLLVVAAFTAAGLATSLAQVYSLNVVGYVNSTVAASGVGGFSILCNPLNNGGNTLNEILPNPPFNTKIYRYNPTNGQFLIYNYNVTDYDTNGWLGPNGTDGSEGSVVFAPGLGFWVKNPKTDNTTATLTFVGEVPQGTKTNPIPAGFELRGSIVPQSLVLYSEGGYDNEDPNSGNWTNNPPANHGINDMNYPVTIGSSRIYQFKPTGDGYRIFNFGLDDNNHPTWDPYVATNRPIPAVGEGFWTKEVAATNWVRTFTVQ